MNLAQVGRIGQFRPMIDKLGFFIALARERHFGRAAEVCGITQPTLSAAIRQLEDQLGVMLVHRGSRFQGLTPEGERALEWARRIVGDARAMKEEMRAVRKGLSGQARIAAIPTALSVITPLTDAFAAKHPGVRLSIISATSGEVMKALDNLSVDVGITYIDNEPMRRVASMPLYSERYQLITAATRPFAERKTVTWAEASQEPLCLLTPDMQNRRIVNQHFAEAGAAPAPRLESNSMIVLFAHVLSGNWSSIMPVNLAETLGFGSAIRAIPLVEPDASHAVGMIAAPRDPQSLVVSALMNEARQFAARFGDQ